jgi:alpha-amylase/alpha-mannosidase (GH57 family)
MTRVALLWHMHQPCYEDLLTQEHILPWVRLHALKDYYGMVALLDEFPGIRVTFNLAPSLLVQIEAFAENRARDRFLDLSLKPAAELRETDVLFIVEHFFHAHRERMIDVYPRYAELLERRGVEAPRNGDFRTVARRFSEDDLRDLQVWHKLAWIDPIYQSTDARVRALLAKGRSFTEDDKAALREVELEILNRVIPQYRAAAARGQIEVSASPFYHPILPLLCDSNIYLRTHPESHMPAMRFAHPDDAFEQLGRAVTLHERLFGRRPVGLWPSEGSVSDDIVPLVARAGFTWMATDELILSRTRSMTFERDAHGHLQQPEHLYAPFRITVGGASVACVFRDHALSDLIGFTYAGWPAEVAAKDFVWRLAEAGRRFTSRTGGEEAVISIILDGENAWEHFEGGGRPFLRALYQQLLEHPDLRTVTMGEVCATTRHELTSIFPGSWIDANFYIWIGHPDDQRAWSQLAGARRALESTTGASADDLARAFEELLVAEGSDWFWWYGDDHSSSHDADFDDLFRRHLRNVYTLLRKPIPDELYVSNISSAVAKTAPTSLLTPTLDGEETSYFEWLGAGTIETRPVTGTMHQAEARASLINLIHVGFDRARFYVRLDSDRPMEDLLAEGYELSLTFLKPAAARFSIYEAGGRLTGAFLDRSHDGDSWTERRWSGAQVAAGSVLEAALPLVDLGLASGQEFAFVVTVCDADRREIERHPTRLTIELTVPDEQFEGRNWSA